MINIEELSILYFMNDEPVPYETKSGYTIHIHPIKVRDWNLFEPSCSILKINKNEINDFEIIKMTYLQFLHDIVIPSDVEWNVSFRNLMILSLHEPIFCLDKNKGKSNVVIGNEDGDVVGLITPKEFDEISKIILFQNFIDYDDRYVNPEVRKMMEDYNRLTSGGNSVNPTLERKIAYVIGKTGINKKDLIDMTYRTFFQVYNSEVESELYLGSKIIQASSKYETKGNITHPLFEKKSDPYEQLFVDRDSYVEKINSIN